MVGAEVRLLGRMAILDRSGRPVDTPLRKTQALLAFLALNPDQRHSRQRLAGLLWGDRDETQARNSLSKSLSTLRRCLGSDAASVIGADPNDIWLQSETLRIDVEALRRLAAGDGDGAVETALALCRGELMEDFVLREAAFNDWLAAERTVVRRLQAETLMQLAEAGLSRGDAGSATALAERLVSLDPLDEAAHRLLMRAHEQAGRRSAALAQYQACKDVLARELGVAPEAATRAVLASLKASEDGDLTPAPSEFDEGMGEVAPVERPSIAVLAFANMSGDPEQEYFSDGITEDIIAELSRFRSLSVLARHSSFAFKGNAVTAHHVGRELGVQYIVEGSVQRSGDRLRVTAQLIDAADGNHLWAEHYDRELEDLFDVRDRLVGSIVATLAQMLEGIGVERARRKGTENLTSYDHLLRGRELQFRATPDGNRESRKWLERAIELDPGYAAAYADLAWTYLRDFLLMWSSEPELSLERGLDCAQRAVALDKSDGFAHGALACAYTYKGRHERAEREIETAFKLNPYDTDTLVLMGTVLRYLGKADEAIEKIESAIRLGPFAPDWYLWDLSNAYYLAGRYDEVIATVREMESPVLESVGILAASYAQVGQDDDARRTMRHFHEMARAEMPDYPGNDLQGWRKFWSNGKAYKNQADVDHLLDGLCKAGLVNCDDPKTGIETVEVMGKAGRVEKPSIAVLAFDNMSGDPEQEYFSDGITEDIITELSRFRSLNVVARSSTFVYRDQAVDVKDAGRALGAQYLLEGSLRKVGPRIRLTAQLIDVETGKHIWAERYDRDLTDIFAMQDELVHTIVTKLTGRLDATEAERSRQKRPENWNAHDYYLRGLQAYRQYNKESVVRGAEMLEKAVALDPSHAKAKALLAWCVVASSWWTSPGDYQPHSDRALLLARQAIEIEPEESFCQYALGIIHFHRQELELAQFHFKRALALNPHDLLAQSGYATYLLFMGKPQQALDQFDKLQEAEPFPPNWYWESRAMALYRLDRYVEAIADFRRMTILNYWNLGHLAACYGQLGQKQKAQACWTEMTEAIPDPMLRMREDLDYFEHPADAEHWLEGLRKAGVTA